MHRARRGKELPNHSSPKTDIVRPAVYFRRRWQDYSLRRGQGGAGCSHELSSSEPATGSAASAPGKEQQAKPGLSSDPPVVSQQPPCPECSSIGTVTCRDCAGVGRLARGGYHKRNRVDLNRILDSKWTAMEETLGWRHFSVKEKRIAGKATCFVRMQASCDSSAQLWVNLQALKDRSKWAAGWLSMAEVLDPQALTSGGAVCRTCAGKGVRVCDVCDGSGRLELIVL